MKPKATKISGSTKSCSVVITKLVIAGVEKWFSLLQTNKTTFWLVFLVCLGYLKQFLKRSNKKTATKNRHASQKACLFSQNHSLERSRWKDGELQEKKQKHHLTLFQSIQRKTLQLCGKCAVSRISSQHRFHSQVCWGEVWKAFQRQIMSGFLYPLYFSIAITQNKVKP